MLFLLLRVSLRITHRLNTIEKWKLRYLKQKDNKHLTKVMRNITKPKLKEKLMQVSKTGELFNNSTYVEQNQIFETSYPCISTYLLPLINIFDSEKNFYVNTRVNVHIRCFKKRRKERGY